MTNNINTTQYPNIHWEKFFGKSQEIETLPTKEWTNNHILFYFCKRFKDHYKVDYTFKFNSTSPSKSYEVFNINKLANMLSSDPIILKEYIDAFFKDIIIAQKKRITSLALLVDANIINKYKFNVLLAGKNNSIGRATPIPSNYLEVVRKFNDHITTYGELSFLSKTTDQKYRNMLDDLSKAGMDIGALDKVK